MRETGKALGIGVALGLALALSWPALAQFKAQFGSSDSTVNGTLTATTSVASPRGDFAAIDAGVVQVTGAAPQVFCAKTDATCQVMSYTADSTTSGTVGSFTLKAGADITATDLLLDVQDSSANHALTVTEDGTTTVLKSLKIAGGSVPALDFTGSVGTIYGTNDSAQIVLDGSTGAQLAWSTIGTVTCNSLGCALAGSGYPALNKSGAGAPAAGDCDDASEMGRIYIDTTNHRFYWCEGTIGWKYAAGT